MIGPLRSLRPVLESLFHRILICPAPTLRYDALKAVKEVPLCIPGHFLAKIHYAHMD